MYKRPMAATAALMLIPAFAVADVTAEEVWADWQLMLGQYGDGIDLGTTSRSGDTLTVSGVVMSSTNDQNTMEVVVPDLAFRDVGDGTVAVTMGPRFEISVVDATVDPPVTVSAEMVQDNFSMIVSGTPARMVHDFTADAVSVGLGQMQVEGEPVDLTMNATLNDILGEFVVEPGTVRNTSQSMTAAGMTVALDVSETGTGDGLKLDGTIDGMQLTGSGRYPSDIDLFDPVAVFGADVRGDGAYAFGGAQYAFEVTEEGQTATGTLSTGGSGLEVAIRDGVVSYDGEGRDMAFAMQGGQLPVPVEVGMASYGYRFAAPLVQSEEPRDFALGMTLGGVTISDLLWGLFDPGQVLPRDPATVSFDITGQGNWLFDPMDPEQAAALGMGGQPGELHQMTLSQLLVELAGARLTGEGGFTFDNEDTQTFNGLPRPEGQIDLMLVGGNALIDNLVAMGLVPQDQAMGARMMLGLFAVPGEGDDTLTSTIEINEQGHILANGQRIQ